MKFSSRMASVMQFELGLETILDFNKILERHFS